MASIKNAYDASVDLTITLASLASDSALLTGRASTVVDNSSNKYVDFLVGGTIMTGTSPAANSSLEVLLWATLNDTPLYPDAVTGSDAGITIATAGSKQNAFFPLATIITLNTSNKAYYFGPISIARLIGFCPVKWGVFVTQNTTANLNATGGNHKISYIPCFATVS